MSEQSGPGTRVSAAKKGIMLAILAVAVAAVALFALMRPGGRETKIIGEGDRAPEFRLTTLEGKQASLSDFRGKVVIVHFWATWCPPCVEEMPGIERLSRSFDGKDFALLAVSVDEGGAQAVASFLNRNKLSLPVLLDPGGKISHSYGTFKFPESYIIDRSGVVRYKVIGPADWNVSENINAIRGLIARQ
jgi:peroxiredoxin